MPRYPHFSGSHIYGFYFRAFHRVRGSQILHRSFQLIYGIKILGPCSYAFYDLGLKPVILIEAVYISGYCKIDLLLQGICRAALFIIPFISFSNALAQSIAVTEAPYFSDSSRAMPSPFQTAAPRVQNARQKATNLLDLPSLFHSASP